MVKRKMLYTPLCCPWCGHFRRCKEQDQKCLVLILAHTTLSVQVLCVWAAKRTGCQLRWVLLCWAQRPCREQHDSRYEPPSHLQHYKQVGFPSAATSLPCDNAPLAMRFVSVAVCICSGMCVWLIPSYAYWFMIIKNRLHQGNYAHVL